MWSWLAEGTVLMLAAAVFLPGQVLALQGFGISPTQQEVTLAPGGSTSGQLTVINDGDTDVTYHIYATDYGVKGEDYEGVFTSPAGSTNATAANWFTLPPGNFVVKARQETTFNYTLTAPKGATVGGHYAAVFIQTIPPAHAGAAIINRVDRIGSLFYITISGALHEHGNLLPLTVPWLQSAPPIAADVRLTNTGNNHFLVQGSAQLTGLFGNKAGNAVQWRGEVLPGTTRRFALALPESAPIGVFKVSVAVTYLGHTAHQSHWLLLVPRLTFIIVSATILLLLVAAFWVLMRKLRRTPAQ